MRLWLALGIFVPAFAQPTAPEPVRSIAAFWSLSDAAKAQPVPFCIECDVTYYDEEWKALWVQDETGAAYIPSGSAPLPIQSGQHIEISGLTLPGDDLSFAGAAIRILGTSKAKPLEPAHRVSDVSAFGNRLVTIDAVACRSVPPVSGHQRYHLSVEGRPALAWVRLAPGEAPPDLTDKYVRLTGVYNPGLDANDALAMLTLMVASTRQIEVVASLASDTRFEIPRIPIDQISASPRDRRVRIAGKVIAYEPGISIQLRDESGQIELHNAQTTDCPLNSMVEAIGYPELVGSEWQLLDPVYRPQADNQQTAHHSGSSDPIRMASQITELSPSDAAAGLPVRLRGIVTWSSPQSPFFFVTDPTGAVRVFREHAQAQLREPGRRIEITGTTRLGPFGPAVEAADFTKIGETILPPATPISLENAMTGTAEARYVEMRGYVREIRAEPPWTRLVVATTNGDFTATIATDQDLGNALDSVVRLRGVCSAITDSNQRLSGIELLLSEPAAIQISEPRSPDPFDRPERSIESLGRAGSIPSYEHRIKVHGTVLQQAPGLVVNIIDNGAPLAVLNLDPTVYPPGSRIEAVGFLGRVGTQLTLNDSIVRRIGSAPLPRALPLRETELFDPARSGQLVRIECTLISIARTDKLVHFFVQAANSIIDAEFPSGLADKTNWGEGSRLALTGIHDLQIDLHGRPALLHLHLRDSSDVEVLQAPPWFNRTRILAICIAFAAGILVFAVWIIALRRRVDAQTNQIRRQLAREAHLEAELQRSSKLEALGLLAGGIAHDFNNLLTVVMGNLSLVREAPALDPDSLACLEQAEQAVGRSRDLTMQLLTFAKGGNPVRAAVSLGEVVQEVTRFALHGSVVRAEFEIPPDLWPAEVDKGQISQVVQNITINAVQAMPQGGRIQVAATNETRESGDRILAPGRYVRLTIADNGPGIPPETLPKIFDPYFTTKKSGHGIGLATVHSIVKKHQGHITVESTVGKGTAFTIWLPASSHALAPTTPPPPRAQPTGIRGRVLILDDEETIRRLSIAMFRRLGLDPVAVADGADAIRTYREARESGHPFALVVLDLTIPGGIGGEETIRELLQIDPAVCAIVSSGYSNNPILSDHRAYGFRGMVSKPYELADLAIVVDELLGTRDSPGNG